MIQKLPLKISAVIQNKLPSNEVQCTKNALNSQLEAESIYPAVSACTNITISDVLSRTQAYSLKQASVLTFGRSRYCLLCYVFQRLVNHAASTMWEDHSDCLLADTVRHFFRLSCHVSCYPLENAFRSLLWSLCITCCVFCWSWSL